jgi:zinc protease
MLDIAPVTSSPITDRPAAPVAPTNAAAPDISHFHLDNGLEVVVIPDLRAPIVTHMIWYRNGSADDPSGKSGIAHFLEHLMFKGTAKYPQSAFSDLVSELGGQENAFTSNDFTAYFQRIAKEHLGRMMEMEADRMVNLVLTDDVVAPERDVVLEERRMRTDTDPAAELGEAVQAALFARHPYGTPVIGWGHEIEELNRDDALTYYRRFYTPENAILIVAGDVTAEGVRILAESTYGQIPARGKAPQRIRAKEPASRAQRLVTLNDEKVDQPSHQRVYLVPSYATAATGEAEALEVLAHILGGGPTSLLYKTLVVERKLAVSAGAYYWGQALDDSRFFLYGMPAEDISLEDLDKAMDEVIAQMLSSGIDAQDLARAKTRLVADAIYSQDNQTEMARWYGMSLTTGMSVADIQAWPERIEALRAQDIVNAAAKWLDRRRSVTGFLLPVA